MFIAIIGTPSSGKSTVESYLISKGFKSVSLTDKGIHEVRICLLSGFLPMKT